MQLTREQIAEELAAAGWSDTAVSDLIEYQLEIQERRAAGVPFVRIERKAS